MAGDDGPTAPTPSIPSWQQSSSTTATPDSPTEHAPAHSASDPELSVLDQARLFLQKDEIKNSPRDRKVAFLEKKGLQADDIQKLLASEDDISSTTDIDGMKTIHDSTTTNTTTDSSASTSTPPTSSSEPSVTSSSPPPQPVTAAVVTPKQDMPPIITYPEFLLKPQKPPPLVTIERLVNAGYALAGISALTWGASRYLVAPMLESLTSARHELQSTSLASLNTLNTKLESAVSHVPYIPPLHSSTKPSIGDDTRSDTTSDSDPTELFHRDIGIQTTPTIHSRRSSTSSTASTAPLSATANQTQRLNSLHMSLSSLLSSTELTFSSDNLSSSITELQTVIDKIESNSQPLYSNYNWRSTSGPNSSLPSSSTWNPPPGSSGVNGSNKTTGAAGKKANEAQQQSEAARFKAEIRALKGAFLSSRNFPSARPIAPAAIAGQGSAYAGR